MLQKITILYLCLLLIAGCNKDNDPPKAVLELQYETAQGNYSGYREFPSDQVSPALVPYARATALPHSDSIAIIFSSELYQQGGDNKPYMNVTIVKTFAKNQLDSVNGEWILKSDNDFYGVFNEGEVAIKESGAISPDGIVLNITPDNSVLYYSTANNLNAHIDPFNSFTITKNITDCNWSSLYNAAFNGNFSARKIMVNLSFQCKAYNSNNPNDSISLTNGVFQGLFVDRN